MRLNVLSVKWRPFCLGVDVLTTALWNPSQLWYKLCFSLCLAMLLLSNVKSFYCIFNHNTDESKSKIIYSFALCIKQKGSFILNWLLTKAITTIHLTIILIASNLVNLQRCQDQWEFASGLLRRLVTLFNLTYLLLIEVDFSPTDDNIKTNFVNGSIWILPL